MKAKGGVVKRVQSRQSRHMQSSKTKVDRCSKFSVMSHAVLSHIDG